MFKFTQKNAKLGSKAFNQILKGISVQNFSSKKLVPSTLDKYDVIIIGSNMGAVLARHIDEITNGRNTVFVASSSAIREQHHLRIAYELGSCKKENYILDTKTILTPFIPHSDGIRVKEIKPESNTVILENNRSIQYRRLVISTGLQNDFEAIPGLKDAIYDQDHPAFSPYDVTGKLASQKDPYYWYNFHGGKCIFYIPKFPIRGEIQEYNFLVAYDQWKENQKNMSQKLNIEFTIVNANDSFSVHSKETDQFLKEELKKRDIKVLYNTELHSLDKNKREVTIIGANGTEIVEKYDNFYSIIPTKGHEFLQQAHLCNEEGLLNVNQHTLQHTKYQNIFGFGDIINVPTTRSFFGTQEQLNVVRHNVIRSLHGQSLNASYDGESKTPLYIGKNKLTFVTQNYFKNSRFNLLDKEGKHLSYIRSFIFSHFYQYVNSAYYKFAIWGKPYYYKAKTYGDSKAEKVAAASTTSTHHSTEKTEQKHTPKQTASTYIYKPTAQYACNDGISTELAKKYLVIQNSSGPALNIQKNELTEEEKKTKEAQEIVKKAEQEQKKKEQQLKREQEEKEQKAREEEFRKKKEKEEQEKKRIEEELEKKRQLEEQEKKRQLEEQEKLKQQELLRQKQEQERVQREEQEKLKKQQEEQEAQRLKQQQLEQEKQAELEAQKKEEVDAEVKQQEETTTAAQDTSADKTSSGEPESPKKRKGRPKKEKKE